MTTTRHGWHKPLGDAKPTPRVKDPSVYTEFHAAGHRCLFCQHPRVEAAHLLGGAEREDVLAGLMPLCSRCHGAWHGIPYTLSYSNRPSLHVEPDLVRERVGHWILSPEGVDAALYLTARLGVDASRAFVERLGVVVE